MSKLPMRTTTAPDETEISRAVSAFQDLRHQVELGDARVRDLEKNLAVSEARAERLEQQCEQLQRQRDDTIQRLVELTTIVQTIGAQIDQARAGVKRTVKTLQQDDAQPARNGGPNKDETAMQMPPAADLGPVLP
jgi:chromosome segregation ATPase